MGKAGGFLKYNRIALEERLPLERIKNWDEFYIEQNEDIRKNQGARCMDCGIPFCHYGNLLKGMVSGCPLNNLIPEWNDLIYRGLYKEAFKRLRATNNFPEFTGRVCPAPCEGSCTLGINEPQVTIKNNECFIIDKAFKQGWVVPEPPVIRTGKKVAIVGSGPSGLACADQLNHLGHTVTVYERSDRIGGLLTYGIPNMKLDKKIVERRIELLIREGIKFHTDIHVGFDFPAEKLREENDAVVLCCGSTIPRDLAVEGRELKGIYFAMEYLKSNTKSLLDSDLMDGRFINAKNQDVIVIGGGDTGTDCVATAIRHGCKSVRQLEIMPQLPYERNIDNPWPEWPKTFKTDYGQEEAKALFGEDPREFLIGTKRFTGDDKGNVKEIETVKVKWEKNSEGRFVIVEIPDTRKIYPATLVLLALGFTGPESTIIEAMGIKRNIGTNPISEYGDFMTDIEGVFAAGDMRRGQSLVVWAINEGRAAASSCDRYLKKSNF